MMMIISERVDDGAAAASSLRLRKVCVHPASEGLAK